MSFRRVLSRTAARSTGGHRNRLRRRFLRCELLEPRNLLAADLDGPVAALLDPVDNGGDDLDETPTVVHIDSTTPPDKFQLSLSDAASGVDGCLNGFYPVSGERVSSDIWVLVGSQ